MKIHCFKDTDTLYIRLNDREIAESRDLDENTVLDLDARATSARSPLSTPASAPMSTA